MTRAGLVAKIAGLLTKTNISRAVESPKHVHYKTEEPLLRRSLSEAVASPSNSEPEIVDGYFGHSGLLLDGDLDNSIIAAERMLAEADHYTHTDGGIFIVERLGCDEQVESSNSSGSREHAGARIDLLTNEYAGT